MIRKDELTLVSRYVHTGNSGATLSIVRNSKRTDGAHLNLKIGAFGKISSDITVIGDEYSGFTADQLRDFAHIFLYAANELEKDSKDQDFFSKRDTNNILCEERKKKVIGKRSYDNDLSGETTKAAEAKPMPLKSAEQKLMKRLPKPIPFSDLPVDIIRTLFPDRFGRTPTIEEFIDANPKLTHQDYLYLALKKAIE